ncbi:FAD-dependent oxidoreductase [Microbacterium sp.]|uniref:FAD-dependent oxidoreductase n=1 Tax=Microbacterium sp. TaxID=51671 RepID=UPI0025FE4473|nr:FAD-dependent oxidoreductase [Microbacterium sp.]
MHIQAHIAVIGGGFGGVSAALAALGAGRTVVMTEPTRWLGGQLTSQMVPLDEHRFIETDGANESYRHFRNMLREYYRQNFPLRPEAKSTPNLNPGAGWVSPVCVDPRVAVAVIDQLLLPHLISGRLRLLTEVAVVSVATEGDFIAGVTVQAADGEQTTIGAEIYLDATEHGDLLDLGGVEFVTGTESQRETGEPGAPDFSDPLNTQAVAWCFALEHREGENHTIDRPQDYAHWRDLRAPQLHDEPLFAFAPRDETQHGWTFEPNPDDDPFRVNLDHYDQGLRPSLWLFRRIAARKLFAPGYLASDITLVNWPMNDYFGGSLYMGEDAPKHWGQAKAQSTSLLYWLQNDAPRPDGGTGWPGLRLRSDVAGTSDGFAMHPYIRESRRIKARKTILEQELSTAYRGDRGAERYWDTVGTGHYFWIDRHHTTRHDLPFLGYPHPFEIPLGALIPVRMRNLLPACKNIGTTQITNGSYRLHPVEWSIGEASGAFAAHCLDVNSEPHAIYDDPQAVANFQNVLAHRGIQLRWADSKRR